jgi:hypothetical protein
VRKRENLSLSTQPSKQLITKVGETLRGYQRFRQSAKSDWGINNRDSANPDRDRIIAALKVGTKGLDINSGHMVILGPYF